MTNLAVKKGAIHLIFIMLFLVIATLIASVSILARQEDKSRRVLCLRNPSDPSCPKDANAKCEILYPTPVERTIKVKPGEAQRDDGGGTAPPEAKPGGVFTVKVTGLTPFQRSIKMFGGIFGPVGYYRVSYMGPGGDHRNAGFAAGPDGTMIASVRVRADSYRPPVDELYVIYIGTGAGSGRDTIRAICGFLVIDPNAPEPTIPRPSASPVPAADYERNSHIVFP